MMPIIGVTPNYRHEMQEICLDEAMILKLTKLGANPVVIPLVPDEKIAVHFLEHLDGVLISGSSYAIDARLYGQENMADLPYGISPYKNAEIPLIQAAIQKHHMPVLGICGGHQAVNVACGGTMIQNIKTEVNGALRHNFQEQPRWYPVHDITVTGYAKSLLGDKIQANSLHDDAIGSLGKGLVLSGSTSDGVCELLESEDMSKQYILGTQFHPELMHGSMPYAIFSDFINAAKKYKEASRI